MTLAPPKPKEKAKRKPKASAPAAPLTPAESRPPLTVPPEGDEPSEVRWTRAGYDALIDAGVLDGLRVERFDGRIVSMPAQKWPHRCALELCTKFAHRAFPTGHRVCVQLPLRADDANDPEPDLAVILGDDPRADDDHPNTAVLVIEVSETTLRHDRRKASRYARAGVGEYWILNLIDRVLEVHRDPAQEAGGRWRYREMKAYAEADALAPIAAPAASVAVKDLLP